MILVCGIPSETSLARVIEALCRRELPHVVVNQRQVRDLALELRTGSSGLGGRLTGPGFGVDLDDVGGVYLRFMDDRRLPELVGEPEDSPARRSSRVLHDHIGHWAEHAEARVVNRYGAMGSNFSKPFQSQLLREAGFHVPATLITNDPDRVDAFADEHGRLVYKSISGERSIVAALDRSDRERLERIRWCPVQFQAFVDGPNVRVHTVGDEVYATIVDTDAVDYRYASQQAGQPARFSPFTLPDDVAERCVRFAASLGLEVAGLDLKFPSDGRVVCLEVNPSPVFSYFEANTGQPIADAVARLLTGSPATRRHAAPV
ncbi:glutathione synthase [Pseudonocardia endophytica]|uniref:Glutathione synthase/RimK-type ligase-like ATP-grasp enzyme n=1 Tax=Pseudonocardia endophytica TaxID=401976 RepID=A0A4R1HGY8_PSEEN|nr:glutathione synthase [Pseudonocardia endophytica]TCK21464.1 glutathione synthase/RimK-type ligase-like ATP-grasp enzyme [Pseudonocardia endophytica]